MIETDLRTFIASRPGITGYIGNSPSRVYIVKAPQNVVRPYIILRRLTGGYAHTLVGAAGFAIPKILVDCYADLYLTAKQLPRETRYTLAGYKGPMDTTQVRGITCDGEEDLYDDPNDGGEIGIFHVALEFGVNYTETITDLTER